MGVRFLTRAGATALCLGTFFLASLVIASLVIASLGAPAFGDEGTGKQAFKRVCAECHGPHGEGGEGAADGEFSDAPPLVPPPHGAQQILSIARAGRGKMPPLPRSAITDAEILAVAAYLQTLGTEGK